MISRNHRYGLLLLALVVALCLFLAYHFISKPVVTTEEVFRSDEAAQSDRAIENFYAVIEKNATTYAARGAHAKSHGCVKAWFRVNESLPPELQHGIFAKPGTRFKSWIRFSNGRSRIKNNDDTDKDAHGMAIKVLLDSDSSSDYPMPVQDFLMHDHPVFFTKDIEEYNQFVESDNKFLYFVSDANPLNWHLREMRHGLLTLKKPPVSPLLTQYFSNTAYKLGQNNIKFSAKSCATTIYEEDSEIRGPDFLRTTMQQQLRKQPGCFDFMVQLQNAGKPMPIEDASIEWKVSDSPYITVARIDIPQQEFDNAANNQFCENLAFSPWHSLTEHKPIGQLNRIRERVYAESAKRRLELNQEKESTNLLW